MILSPESLSCPTCLIALAATASFMADRNVEGEMVVTIELELPILLNHIWLLPDLLSFDNFR